MTPSKGKAAFPCDIQGIETLIATLAQVVDPLTPPSLRRSRGSFSDNASCPGLGKLLHASSEDCTIMGAFCHVDRAFGEVLLIETKPAASSPAVEDPETHITASPAAALRSVPVGPLLATVRLVAPGHDCPTKHRTPTTVPLTTPAPRGVEQLTRSPGHCGDPQASLEAIPTSVLSRSAEDQLGVYEQRQPVPPWTPRIRPEHQTSFCTLGHECNLSQRACRHLVML